MRFVWPSSGKCKIAALAAVVALAFLITAVSPNRAMADYPVVVTADPADQPSWLQQLANDAKEIANQVEQITHLVEIINLLNTIYTEFGIKDYLDKVRMQLLNEAAKRRTQAIIDQQYQLAEEQKLAALQQQHTMAKKDTTCATGVSADARQAMTVLQNFLASQYAYLLGGARKGSGSGACENCPAASAIDVETLCKLQIFDPNVANNSSWMKAANCTPISTSSPNYVYVGADILESSVTTPILVDTGTNAASPGALEYPLPASAGMTPDGHVTFQGQTANITGNQYAFVAAYEYCDHLATVFPSANPGPTPTVQNVTEMKARLENLAVRASATRACSKALAYRTACPQSSAAAVKSSNGQTCYDTQVFACKILKAPLGSDVTYNTSTGATLTAKAAGLGLDPSQEPSLQNCETIGLSAAEHDRIWYARYRNHGFQTTASSVYGPTEAHHVLTVELPAQEQEFFKKLDAEDVAITEGAQFGYMLRGAQDPSNIIARPLSPSGAAPVSNGGHQ